MSTGEEIYLAMVIASLVGFAVTLGMVAWLERSWAHKHGR
jgi:hypothetical protein